MTRPPMAKPGGRAGLALPRRRERAALPRPAPAAPLGALILTVFSYITLIQTDLRTVREYSSGLAERELLPQAPLPRRRGALRRRHAGAARAWPRAGGRGGTSI
jgi:hypothetical protein